MNSASSESTAQQIALRKMQKSIAIVGCGAVVEIFYLAGLEALRRRGWSFQFVDATLARAEALAGKFKGATAHASVSEISQKTTHAVVATPPADHFQTCRNLLARGVHVLCEKPLTLYTHEAEELAETARREKRRLEVNQTRRWFPANQLARKAVSAGDLGVVRSVDVREGIRFSWPARSAFHSQVSLQRNGIISDQGSHVFDAVSWILGQPLEPIAVSHDGYSGPEITVHISFRSGAISGEGILTWLTEVPYRLEIVGDRASLVVSKDLNEITLVHAGRREVVRARHRLASYEAAAVPLLSAFVGDGDSSGVASVESVVPSVQFLDRCYAVAQPLLPRASRITQV
jgi:predicted dehydrogenase